MAWGPPYTKMDARRRSTPMAGTVVHWTRVGRHLASLVWPFVRFPFSFFLFRFAFFLFFVFFARSSLSLVLVLAGNVVV